MSFYCCWLDLFIAIKQCNFVTFGTNGDDYSDVAGRRVDHGGENKYGFQEELKQNVWKTKKRRRGVLVLLLRSDKSAEIWSSVSLQADSSTETCSQKADTNVSVTNSNTSRRRFKITLLFFTPTIQLSQCKHFKWSLFINLRQQGCQVPCGHYHTLVAGFKSSLKN